MLFLLQGAFEVVCTRYPKAATRMLAAMAKKLATASAARTSPNQVKNSGHLLFRVSFQQMPFFLLSSPALLGAFPLQSFPPPLSCHEFKILCFRLIWSYPSPLIVSAVSTRSVFALCAHYVHDVHVDKACRFVVRVHRLGIVLT